MKGGESGHTQVVKDIAFDCDGDTCSSGSSRTARPVTKVTSRVSFALLRAKGDTFKTTEAQLLTPEQIYGKEEVMQSPTLEEFLKLADQGNLIPVTTRILADIETPLSAYRKIRGGRIVPL